MQYSSSFVLQNLRVTREKLACYWQFNAGATGSKGWGSLVDMLTLLWAQRAGNCPDFAFFKESRPVLKPK